MVTRQTIIFKKSKKVFHGSKKNTIYTVTKFYEFTFL